jgi:hypothetical protein
MPLSHFTYDICTSAEACEETICLSERMEDQGHNVLTPTSRKRVEAAKASAMSTYVHLDSILNQAPATLQDSGEDEEQNGDWELFCQAKVLRLTLSQNPLMLPSPADYELPVAET